MKRPQIKTWPGTRLGMKLLVIAFVPFVLISACNIAMLSVLSDAQAEARSQQRARQLISDCENAVDTLIMSGTLLSFYFRAHNPEAMSQYRKTIQDLMHKIDDLQKQAQDDDELSQIAQALVAKTHELNDTVNGALEIHQQTKKRLAFIQYINLRQQAIEVLSSERHLIDALEAVGTKRISSTAPHHSPAQVFLRKNISLAIALSVFASISLALFLARDIVERLRVLTDKAARLALLQAPGMAAKGSDEIAQLDKVFNDMAKNLLDAIKSEQAAVACAADAIISLSGNGAIKAINSAMVQKTGWQTEELLGRNILELVPPSDQQPVLSALSNTTPDQFQAPLLMKDGHSAACIWSVSWSPGEQSMVAIVHDVSERKRAEDMLNASEARTKLLMERMPAGLALIARDGTIRFANDTVAQLTGRSKESLVGCQFTSLLIGSTFDTPEAFVELMSQRAQAYITAIDKPGSEETRVELGFSRFGRQNDEDLFLVIMVDYTERWQFEELKQRLIAMIAHDIATPLVTVQSTLTMATSGMFGDVKPARREQVDAAEHESSDILQVFKNVVRFQKLASGFTSMAASQLPLADLTREALDVVSSTAAEKDIEITSKLDEVVAAIGDADKLAVLGATLLQTVVDTCANESRIAINAAKHPSVASWILAVTTSEPISERARHYFTDMDVFQESAQADTRDLDLVLWRLLMYQCGAKISYSASGSGYLIELQLPALEMERIPAA